MSQLRRLIPTMAASLTLLVGIASLFSPQNPASAATYDASYQASDLVVAPSISGKTVPVIVTNTGSATWDTGGSFYLSYHLYQGTTLIAWSGLQTYPPVSVAPGSSLILAAKIAAPATEGTYTLQWDMVGPSGVFSSLGVPTGNIRLTVTASAPAATSLNPSSVTAGASATSLTVTGSNFTSNLSVQWNGLPLATTYVDATHLTATIPSSNLADPGSALVTVANATGQSIGPAFTIAYPTPTIGTLSPNSIPAPSNDLTITITGANFYDGSAAYASNIGGSGYLTTTFVSPTQLTAVLPASRMLTPATGTIIVRTPDRTKSSNTLTFTVTQALPVLSSLSPASIFATQPGFTMTLTGANFLAGATAYWNGTPLATTFVDSTTLRAQVPASAIGTPGSAAVTVAQSSGSSWPQTFTILTAEQTISFDAIPDKTVGDPPFALSAVASSGLPVTLSVSGECSLSGNTLMLLGLGACAVTASQNGDGIYNPAPSVTRTFAITKLNQAIAFEPIADQPVNAAPFVVSATASSGLPVTLESTGPCTLSGNTLSLTAIGTCAVTASQNGSETYNPSPSVIRTFSIRKADQTLAFDPITDRLLSAGPFVVVPSASSGLPVSLTATGPCELFDTTVSLLDVGTCMITAAQDGDTIYNPAPPVTRAFVISRLSQTIAFDPIPDKQSTELPFAVSASASSGLPVIFTATGSCALSGPDLVVVESGICTVTAEQDGDDSYEAAEPVSRGFMIARLSQTITFDPILDRLTIDPPFAITPAISSDLPVTVTTDGPCTVTGNMISTPRVGLCTVTVSHAGDQLYDPAEASRSFTVTAPKTSDIPLSLGALTQASPDTVAVTFIWPEAITGTLHRVNCGTMREQIVSGRTGTCKYTKAGTYKLQGTFTPTDGGSDTTTAPTQVQIPSVTPSGVAMRLALLTEGQFVQSPDSRPDAPAYLLTPAAYPPTLAVTAEPILPADTPVGVAEQLDTTQSTITVSELDPSTGAPAPNRTPVTGKFRFNSVSRLYTAAAQLRGALGDDKSLSVGKRHRLTVAAKTTGGAVLPAQADIAVAYATLDPTVKTLLADGPYPSASYRFRVTNLRSPVKRDRLSYLWTVTRDDDPTPINSLSGVQSMRLTIDEPGTYHVAMTAKGALSEPFTWTTTIEVPPFPDPATAAIRIAVEGINRPPVPYRFKALLPILPTTDRYTAITWTVDGRPLSNPPSLHLFTEPGPHTVHLEATTSTGTTYTGDASVDVEPNLPPSGRVDCSRTKPALANAALACNAIAVDPDGRIAKSWWVVPQLGIDKSLGTSLRLTVAEPPPTVAVEYHMADNSGAEIVLMADVPLIPAQDP